MSRKPVLLSEQKAEAARLGRRAVIWLVGVSVGAFVLSYLLGSWKLGLLGWVVGLVFAGKHLWRWLQYRGQWGMYF